MRRVDCPRCGVKVELVPRCDGKNQLAKTYRWFVDSCAKRLSWKDTAEAIGTIWQNVSRSVTHAVAWGLARCDLEADKQLPWKAGKPRKEACSLRLFVSLFA